MFLHLGSELCFPFSGWVLPSFLFLWGGWLYFSSLAMDMLETVFQRMHARRDRWLYERDECWVYRLNFCKRCLWGICNPKWKFFGVFAKRIEWFDNARMSLFDAWLSVASLMSHANGVMTLFGMLLRNNTLDLILHNFRWELILTVWNLESARVTIRYQEHFSPTKMTEVKVNHIF